MSVVGVGSFPPYPCSLCGGEFCEGGRQTPCLSGGVLTEGLGDGLAAPPPHPCPSGLAVLMLMIVLHTQRSVPLLPSQALEALLPPSPPRRSDATSTDCQPQLGWTMKRGHHAAQALWPLALLLCQDNR